MIGRAGLDVNLLIAFFGDPEGWSGVSASSAGATNECPTRLALPQARSSGEYAERGNALHAFARVLAKNPDSRETALLDVPEEWRHTAAGMRLEEALAGITIVGCESAFALDAKTRKVRFIGENIDRDYNGELARKGQPPLSRYEIPFTMDVAGFVGDVPIEVDYKSGMYQGEASEQWQRKVCCAGLMYLHDAPTAKSRTAYIWDDGRMVVDPCEFSVLEAEDFCDELVETIDAVWEARLLFANGIMPTVYPSDTACKYCPAFMSCPYQMNIARSMLGKLQDVTNGPDVSTLSLEELGQVWVMMKAVEKLIEPLEKSLKAVASKTPLPIDERKEVRPSPRSRSFFNDAAARGEIVILMGKLGYTEEQIAAKLASFTGKTEYEQYGTVNKPGVEKAKPKRKLQMAG